MLRVYLFVVEYWFALSQKLYIHMYDISYTVVHTFVWWPAFCVQVDKIEGKQSSNRFGGSKEISGEALKAAHDVFAKIKFKLEPLAVGPDHNKRLMIKDTDRRDEADGVDPKLWPQMTGALGEAICSCLYLLSLCTSVYLVKPFVHVCIYLAFVLVCT